MLLLKIIATKMIFNTFSNVATLCVCENTYLIHCIIDNLLCRRLINTFLIAYKYKIALVVQSSHLATWASVLSHQTFAELTRPLLLNYKLYKQYLKKKRCKYLILNTDNLHQKTFLISSDFKLILKFLFMFLKPICALVHLVLYYH